MSNGCLILLKLPSISDLNKQNTILTAEEPQIFEPRATVLVPVEEQKALLITEPTAEDIANRKDVEQMLVQLGEEVRELIDYDISVTGQTQGIYRKFCLNDDWLRMLTEQAKQLCEVERESITNAIDDQVRIRDWIFNLVSSSTEHFSYKVRALFSESNFEKYSISRKSPDYLTEFDMFRMYDLEPVDEDMNAAAADSDDEELGEEEGEEVRKALKRFVIHRNMSVYDHIMSMEFRIQDKDEVTVNQLYNELAKFQVVLSDQLRLEFNKKFEEVRLEKEETMQSILNTNSVLKKIYSNMNCMLCLLNMEQFEPPVLSVPEWSMDENLERILTVSYGFRVIYLLGVYG